MTRSTLDMAQLQDDLVEACSWGEEARARAAVSLLARQPRKARAMLDAMLRDPDAEVRQAAAFGLGELGGAASARLLERQLVLEEARGDHDGASVAEAITLSLGRIEEAGARASLVRRLERLVASTPDPVDVNMVAYALWRRRHPDLLPAVRRSLAQLAPPAPICLLGLLVLLEKPPASLRSWVLDASVPVEHKTGVLSVLEEELPEELRSTLPSFISAAQAQGEVAPLVRNGATAHHLEGLFSLLLQHKEELLPSLPAEARAQLRDLARKLIVATTPNSSIRAALLLQFVGQLEDANFIEAHRPTEPILAKVFDEAAQALRGLRSQ